MALLLLLFAVDVLFVVHAAKTGRVSPWAYIIVALPAAGALAYALFAWLPAWLAGPRGSRLRACVTQAFDPERRYAALTAELEASHTVANRAALAAECLALEKYEEAKRHYGRVLAHPLGDEPEYMVGRARAEFGLRRPNKTIATLDRLREFWPDFQSADAHLLYARALESTGREAEALDEYAALARYYPGPEARVRWALLLDRVGRGSEAKRLFADVVAQMARAPGYVRRMQARWIDTAKDALKVSRV
jgi:hypothetical protein